MVKLYRCKGCGYVHVGFAPEHCPVCGAPKASFVEYDGPGDLSGTRALENLKTAFTGEAQANRTYLLFARIAEVEEAHEARAAFERAAAEETAHALGHLAYISEFGTTAENLDAAASGEDHESQEMYPEFAEIAEEEGYPEIAFYFRAIGRFEREHRDEYRKAREALEG